MRGIDALDLVFPDKARFDQVVKDAVEKLLLLAVLEQPLPEITEGGMVKGPFVQLEAQGVLDLDVEHAGVFHLPVRKRPIELDDGGQRHERWRDRRAAVVLAVHRVEVLVLDEGSDNITELAVEAVGRDQPLAEVGRVEEAALAVRFL